MKFLKITETPEREIVRMYLYADCFGMEAVFDGDGKLVIFEEPDCEDWDCLNPTHQIARYQ